MNDVLAVTLNPSVRAPESAPAPRTSAAEAEREPRMAFEDTPALAKLREEQRADKHRRSGSEDGESQPAGDSVQQEQVASSKTNKREPAAVDANKAGTSEAKDSHTSEGEDDGSEPSSATISAGEAVQAMASPSPQSQDAGTVIGDEKTDSPLDAVAVSAQEAGQAKEPSLPTGQTGQVASTDVSGKTEEGNVPLAEVATAKGAVADDVQATAVETKGEPTEASKSSQGQEAVSVAEKNVAFEGSDAKAERPGEFATVAKAGEQVTEGKTQAAEGDSGEVVSGTRSVAKASAEAGGTAVSEVKAERDEMSSHRTDRSDSAQQGFNAKTGSETVAAAMSEQGKDAQLSASGDGLKEQIEVAVPGNDGSATFAQRLAGQEAGAPAPETATPKSETQSVSDQILDSVRASVAAGDKQVTVRLDPPELGTVTVKFQEQGDQIRAVVEVSRPDTRQEVERAMPEVLRTLQDAGVQIRRVEVVLSEQSGRDYNKDHLSQQDTWSGQQNSQQNSGNPRHTSSAGWQGPFTTTYTNATTQEFGSQNHASPGRINMLM